MSKECSIVKDLLPLYVEDMVSEETATFIEEHLQTCIKCKELFDSMKESNNEIIIENEISEDAKVIKNINSKWIKKRLLIMISTVALTLGVLLGYLVIEPYLVDTKINYWESEIYTVEDKQAAIDVIMEQFNKFEGCVLYEINYTSDNYCLKNLDYVNGLADEGTTFTECIVFETQFRSPIFGGGAWNAGMMYDWNWYLGRTDGGTWQLLTWGF